MLDRLRFICEKFYHPHVIFVIVSISFLFIPTPLNVFEEIKARRDVSAPFTILDEPAKPLALDSEVLNLLDAAKKMRHNQKLATADKLYNKALQFAPDHPEILIEYANFLENEKHDIVKADSMYSQALAKDPSNEAAIKRHKINLPQVMAIDLRYYELIDSKRVALSQIPASDMAFRRAKREFYFQLIYHNNAIEGNTMTLSMTRSVLETGRAIGGQSIQEHNEIIGMDAALHFLNGTMLGKNNPLKVSTILDIHRRLLGNVDPINAGMYRTHQVYVGNFVPPKPQDVPTLMEDFIQWLNSEEAWNLHAVEYAALAHYRLVYIHPFVDGNGRTSRLLMNLRLIQAGYPPVIIKVEDRYKYYEALETANSGDVRPFIRFIAKCTQTSLDGYLHSLGLEVEEFEGELENKAELEGKESVFINGADDRNVINLP